MKTCPVCRRKPDPVRSRNWLPFCSERCKLIDLGKWLNEDHRIPADASDFPSAEDDDPPVRH